MKQRSLFYRQLPLLTGLAILVTVVWVDLNHKRWNNLQGVIFWDIINYYAYLPATIIYGDPGMNFIDDNPAEFQDKIWVQRMPNGRYVNKMSMGMSVAYSPFFLMAHALAKPLGYPSDGYSVPYRFALVMSSLAYLLLGLFFVARILKRWFSPLVISLTMIGIVIGTNLLFYTTIEAPMSHVYSFALFAFFLWTTLQWYDHPSAGWSILLGLLAGWIALIRPTNLLIIILFLTWGITNVSAIKARLQLFLRNYPLILLMVLAATMMWIPQLLYWKYTTGSWLYWSYGDERFFFDQPAIMKGLFSYRKGWLLYTPLMILALLGIIRLRRRLTSAFLPVLLFVLLNIYIVTSWWSWWYGGSFGLRAFIDSYSILALPLAASLEWILSRRIGLKVGLLLVFILLVAHSIFQTFQYYYGSIHWDGMTRAAYRDSFLRLRPGPDFYNLVEPPPSLQERLEEHQGHSK